ncbi:MULTISPECIES: SLAP domain-containing protein [unclassified Lactobacillus]|uniref:SLAP domain-containing protein n=1 Tax=unclassified Lactobacillus TaxID=2620435 RepID=UPI000EFBE8D3|nr:MULTISPECIES: SLAP domain-containing protein [unclassified Lactobacillus]RMC40028.1 hypothetical protein F5ESL0237_03995 [Lactobacillus sp. ESL0237]RMC44189.1 hypothetical protein F5ESL0234_04000 [Lactobacillus sp. ESL0234]RMC45517.1 hypothetical protein F5ESL0236_04000 [Lactobacillus sp. ESL0236]RMC50788.1 hypothetical protein F5ESL0225_04130 [Lactobacillus sp. ESL0225]
MNKKILISFVGTASALIGLSASIPVSAAEANSPVVSKTELEASNSSKTPVSDANKTDNSSNKTATETPKSPEKPNGNTNAISLMGKTVRLTRNSYVYDKHGKRVKNKKLKKGLIVGISSFTTVNGKPLIGFNNKENQFIKPANVKILKAVRYRVKRNAFVYNAKGVRDPRYYVKKGKKVVVFSTKKVKGIKLVGISEKQFIKWADLDSKSAEVLAE